MFPVVYDDSEPDVFLLQPYLIAALLQSSYLQVLHAELGTRILNKFRAVKHVLNVHIPIAALLQDGKIGGLDLLVLEWQLQCLLFEYVEGLPSWIAELIVIWQHPYLFSVLHDPALPWRGDKLLT